MMKITNTQLLKSVSGLQELSKLQLPVKASWNIGKNIRFLQNALDDYTAEAAKILKTNTTEKSSPNQPIFIDQQKYQDEIAELGAIEIEIKITPIKLSWLLTAQSTPMNPSTLSSGSMSDLYWFIEDDTAEENIQAAPKE